MRRIDVHHHFTPDFYRDQVLAAGLMPTSGVYPAWSPELALEFIDQHGIATAMMSISHPGVHLGDAAQAKATARRCNELAADMAARWPGRFGSFLALPLPDVGPSLEEIAYGFDTLHADGVCLLASYQGKFLGDAAFDPVLEELDRRAAIVFIHPSGHGSTGANALPWPMFIAEFPFDTSRAVINLMYSGAVERYPRIRFILSHAGGTIPFLAWRLANAPLISPLLRGWSPERTQQVLRSFWYDTALSAGPQVMACLQQVAAPERILFGSDWPPAGVKAVQANIDALADPSNIAPAQRAGIERQNALALFPRLA